MKAIYFERHGEPEVLQYGDLPDPIPQAGQALLRVHATSLNHLDIWVRRGWKGLHLQFPHITGSDIAGEVLELRGESNFRPGDRVMVYPGVNPCEDEWTARGEESVSPQYQVLGEHLPGGLAEKVCVPLSNLAPLPKAISYEAAAAQILVATTSWRMLVKQGKVKKGEDILVVGAGGGLNSLSIQLAKSFGLRVFCLTSSKEKEAKAKALGAEQVFNYREVPEWHKLIRKETGGRGVDIVIDNVGRETFSQSMKALRHGGRLVTVGNTSGPQIEFDNRLLFGKQLSLIGSTMGSKQDFLDALDYIWKNNLPPIIDRLVPLEHGIQEIQRLEEGRQFGKIVLLPSAS